MTPAFVVFLCSSAFFAAGFTREIVGDAVRGTYGINDTSRGRRDVIRGASMAKSDLLSLHECAQLYKMCPRLSNHNSDLDVLECVHLSDQPEDRNDLGEGCRKNVWRLATRLLEYKESLALLEPYCQNERLMESHLSRCRMATKPEGLLKCFVDNLSSLENKDCADFVSRISFLTFIDSKTMSMYLEDCQRDVIKLNCSSTSADRKLSCLQNQLENLSKECQSEVLRLSEVQGEDIKLDHALFRACSDERRRFCHDQNMNPNKVYECLFLQKNEVVMSSGCLAELLRREKLIAQDYQVSRALVKACKEDIKANRCRKAVSEDRDIRLAQILMCLENATRYGIPVQNLCREEMIQHRRLLLEDYRLSPELVSKCSKDISKFCKRVESDGKTIHCLMGYANPRMKKRISPPCLAELESLAEKTDIGEDWRADRVLWKSCSSVADVACRSVANDNTKTMNCLFDKMGTDMMTKDCDASLRTVQYFMARDFKLDPILFKACRSNAAHYCGFGSFLTNKALVLPCLYRIIDELDLGCRREIRRVMKQRALDVDLHPNIENACMDDLGVFCSENTGKRDEVQCLQNNLEKLKPNCAMAVYNFTELQAEFIELNPIITSNCREVTSELCRPEQTKSEDILDCLIEKKNDPLMKIHFKCRAAIEHHQLISLKDFQFTFKFKKACKNYVSRFCPGAKEKAEVVRCLSEQIRNDTLQDQKQRVSKECHQQLRSQLLQQRESIELNTKLKADCLKDINTHCSGVTPGNGRILECLVSNKRNLEEPCRRRIFFVERQELTDSFTDYTLLQACKPMLEKYCPDTSIQPLACLKKYKYFEDFDFKCREVVVRRMIEQSNDYRFDPNLSRYCKADIKTLCYQVTNHNWPEAKEFEGKVIGCLKVNFRKGKLTTMCEKQVVSILKEAALNYKLNPLLSNLCSKEIRTLCATEETEKIDKGKVEECLKEALLNGQIADFACRDEIVELINVGKADISADPLLNSACTDDINEHCTHVDYGAGRKLDCLIETYQKKIAKLKWQCEKLLKERIEMYKIQRLQQIENLSELYGSVYSSPAKKYFMVVALTFVGMIFMSGMFCGRNFRRSVATKNK